MRVRAHLSSPRDYTLGSGTNKRPTAAPPCPRLSSVTDNSILHIPISIGMSSGTKKSTSKASSKSSIAANQTSLIGHPSWVEMIKECIVAYPSEARTGVSRPTIKKFIEDKYHIELTSTAASMLGRAIHSGSEKGIFQLPKGPSGKVKLAAKARTDASKENTKPVTKRHATTTKAKSASKTAVVKKPATKTTAKAKATATKAAIGAGNKKAPAKKSPALPTKKGTATKKLSVTGKKSTTAKTSAKKVVVGEGKKPALKPKARAAPASATNKVKRIPAKPSSSKTKTILKPKSTPKVKSAPKAKPAPKPGKQMTKTEP